MYIYLISLLGIGGASIERPSQNPFGTCCVFCLKKKATSFTKNINVLHKQKIETTFTKLFWHQFFFFLGMGYELQGDVRVYIYTYVWVYIYTHMNMIKNKLHQQNVSRPPHLTLFACFFGIECE